MRERKERKSKRQKEVMREREEIRYKRVIVSDRRQRYKGKQINQQKQKQINRDKGIINTATPTPSPPHKSSFTYTHADTYTDMCTPSSCLLEDYIWTDLDRHRRFRALSGCDVILTSVVLFPDDCGTCSCLGLCQSMHLCVCVLLHLLLVVYWVHRLVCVVLHLLYVVYQMHLFVCVLLHLLLVVYQMHLFVYVCYYICYVLCIRCTCLCVLLHLLCVVYQMHLFVCVVTQVIFTIEAPVFWLWSRHTCYWFCYEYTCFGVVQSLCRRYSSFLFSQFFFLMKPVLVFFIADTHFFMKSVWMCVFASVCEYTCACMYVCVCNFM